MFLPWTTEIFLRRLYHTLWLPPRGERKGFTEKASIGAFTCNKEESRRGYKISAWLELYGGACRIYGMRSARTITQDISRMFESAVNDHRGQNRSAIIYFDRIF